MLRLNVDRKAAMVGLVIILAAFAVSISLYIFADTSKLISHITSSPIDYALAVDPSNVSVLQGQNVSAYVSVSYMQGTPENVTFTAAAPDGVTCTFSQDTAVPEATTPFNSTLQVEVAATVPSGVYNLNITSTAQNGKAHSANFTLTVLNAFINVSGTVTADGDYRMYPTRITFENLKTHEKYSTPIWTTPASGEPRAPSSEIIQTGRYWILLPNQEGYNVTCSWSRFMLFGGTGEALGSFNAGTLEVDCGVGVDWMSNVSYPGSGY